MVKGLFAWMTILILAFAQSAQSQQQPKPTNIRNAGSFSCSDFLPVVNSPGRELEKTAFLQWAAGYSAAAAKSNSLIDLFPIGDTWELIAMTAFVCQENQEVNFEAALRTALGRLRPYWIREDPAILTLNDPSGRVVQFYAEATAQLQRDLRHFGTGVTVDGVYGNQTGNAILRLNQNRGSTPYLTPDGEFLYQLTLPR